MSSTHTGIRSSFCAFLLVLLMATEVPAQNFRGGINGTVIDLQRRSQPRLHPAVPRRTQPALSTRPSRPFPEVGPETQTLRHWTYDVVVSASGLESLKVTNVPVSAGTIYTISATSKIGSVAIAVEVNANEADVSLETTTVNQTTVIHDKTIQDTR